MSKTKKNMMPLEALASVFANMPNIWNATTVESEPQKWLERWQVYKVIDAKIQPEVFGYHFVGYDIQGGHGAVSSKIGQFDPVKMCGITNSGRIYQLVGMPGTDPDAQYTLSGWAAANQVTVVDATAEFIQHYSINLDQVHSLGKP
jgi:hypothetical protein